MKKVFLNYSTLFIVFTLSLLISCTETKIIYRDKVFYELPIELRFPEEKDNFLDQYSPIIFGKKIFLDAGHGGSDRKNIGTNKLVFEADINLNVVLYLKEFLIEAGAIVYLSRDEDKTVDLKLRSHLADSSGADIFISVHHNAPPDSTDNYTNYTATYYHATEIDYEYEPCERDLARFIQRDLSYAMRNPGGLGSFDGTYPDYSIYSGQGFSVLRETTIPAVLVECGFHTNNFEEKRLSIKEFNRIEAWGIFRGLCRYFANGIPKIFFSEELSLKNMFAFYLNDNFGIDSSSISLWIDKSDFRFFSFDVNTGLLKVDVSEISSGEHELKIVAANTKGNHTFPFVKKISVNY